MIPLQYTCACHLSWWITAAHKDRFRKAGGHAPPPRNSKEVLVLTTPYLFSSFHPTMSSINFSAFGIFSLELSSSLIAHSKPLLRQLHWLPVQSRSHLSLPPLETKPFSSTTRNTLFHLYTITNLSNFVDFNVLIGYIPFRYHQLCALRYICHFIK